eukprot:4018048-Pyramimonas_sp.AAC.1
MDRAGRRKFRGRAGPPPRAWRTLSPSAPVRPQPVQAWRILGRWLRRARSARAMLCRLASERSTHPSEAGRLMAMFNQFYFLQGFALKVRARAWVLENASA